MVEQITMNLPTTLYAGKDAVSNLSQEAKRIGRRPLVVCDGLMIANGYLDLIKEYLATDNQEAVVFSDIKSEPTQDYVVEAEKLVREHNCDYVVAIGGGSCIDTAKAVAAVVTNNCDISDFYGSSFEHVIDPLPLIAIPTTAGTGSEVTDVTVITNTSTNVKMMLKNRIFLPKVAISDAQFTATVPPSVTAATGLDALCHSIESFVSVKANSMTKLLSLDALNRIMHNIVRVYQDGDDAEARDEMMLGSTQAGIAFSNSSVTLIHGMSRPVGALFHVPHGLSNAMLLPVFLEYNRDVIKDDLAVICDTVFPSYRTLSSGEKAEYVERAILNICKQLHLKNIQEFGVDKEGFLSVVDKMAEDALASGSPQNNKKVPTKEEIKELYIKAYDYKG